MFYFTPAKQKRLSKSEFDYIHSNEGDKTEEYIGNVSWNLNRWKKNTSLQLLKKWGNWQKRLVAMAVWTS